MSENVKGFIVLRQFSAGIGMLTTLQKGKLMEALFADMEGETLPDLDMVTKVVLQMMLPSVHEAQNNFKSKGDTARENGAKGGRPRKDAELQDEDAQTEKPSENPKTHSVFENQNRIEENRREENLNTPPLPPSGGSEVCEKYSQAFLDFWAHYPRKVGKDAAWKAWKRVKKTIPKPEELAAILERQKNSDDWRREGGKFIPHPATWLNQGRWKDEGLDAAVAEEQCTFPQWAVPKPPSGPRERILVNGVWQ